MAEPLLQIENLSKTFRRRFVGRRAKGDATRGASYELHAVDGISLTVERGDIFGFLGPNGAGKSTTLRMCLGLIHPSAGRVAIGGHDLVHERLAALRKVGAFVESPAFYPYLSGRKNLEIFAGLSGACPPDLIDRTLELVGLRGREHERVQVYSHGMRARLGIAACLLPRPELLLLDEPTDGLDPHGIREIRDLLKHLNREEGLTVFLSSHLLGEVENLCNRIAILERGRIILQGELEDLERRHRRYRIETNDAQAAQELLKARFKLAPSESPRGQRGFLVALDGYMAADVNAALTSAGLAVRCFAPEEGWLDRLFLERTTTRESALRRNTSD